MKRKVYVAAVSLLLLSSLLSPIVYALDNHDNLTSANLTAEVGELTKEVGELNNIIHILCYITLLIVGGICILIFLLIKTRREIKERADEVVDSVYLRLREEKER